MDSIDSDDEPLSVLALAKKQNPEKFVIETKPKKFVYEPKRKKRKPVIKTKESPFKKLPLTIKFSRKVKDPVATVVQRPNDVWLYLKDLKPSGPYSCLLCPDWFVNRAKFVLHYILNHRKDFCGICKYFLPDRETWIEHQKFHTPWPCSQCVESFPTDPELRQHFSSVHELVHCRLCHFCLSNDQYNTHLHNKHNVTTFKNKEEEILWKLETDFSKHFQCLLCSKSDVESAKFFNHFMGYHHFTLQCFTSVISGKDISIIVTGADVSADIAETLKDKKFGYVELNQTKTDSEIVDHNNAENIFLNALIPEIKQEVLSETEDVKTEEVTTTPDTVKVQRNLSELVRSYKGKEDFDVTLMELILIEKCYFDYANQTLIDINSNNIPENSDINYEDTKVDIIMNVNCALCNTNVDTSNAFTSHMLKMHSIKTTPLYSCRVCVTTFDTQQELDNHISEELGDFEDLWICQFCDKEFDNRQSSRRHLTEHQEIIEVDNCFSPHIGFKCKYCSILFWNETDRELHQVRVHFSTYKEHYYSCKVDDCSDIFSDKVWFIHHYLQKHHNEEDKIQYLVKCCICSLVLTSVELMRSHFKTKHPDAKKVFCSLDNCQHRPLSHKKSFQLHLRSMHSLEVVSREVSCPDCSETLPNARALATHAARVHSRAKLQCKICDQTLRSNDERKLHYILKHPGQHPYECSICGKSFQYKSTLYMHRQQHVPNKQSFTCSICNKVFNKKDSFREHMAIHEGPRHACSYCPMRFVQRSNMVRHERRHTGERPYACVHCPRTFADKGACTSHLKTHSRKSPYTCMYCGKAFKQKSKLNYHTRKHTGENLETCPVCSKLFTSGCSLREHMKIHDPNKKVDVPCPLCGRIYQDERYMLRHLRTSHSYRRYGCPLCDKTLSSACGLRHHVLTHSPLNIFRCKSCPKSYNVRRTMYIHLRKRHNLKLSNGNLRDHFTKLDPSECKLNLDEATFQSIFGPPKRDASDTLIADYVTIPESNLTKDNTEGSVDHNETDDGSENETDNESYESEQDDEGDTKIKDENYGENALEPTDFVSVKIEPLEEDEDELSD